jgi:opacity protein-like surface antigen
MIFKRTAVALAALLALAACSAVAQVVPSAEAGGLPLVAGGGASRFNMDCGPYTGGSTCYMNGITIWVDWNLTRLPGPVLLRGLGVEIEGRDLNFALPVFLSNTYFGDAGTNLRQDTGLGGLIYHYRRFHRVRPYGKVLAGLGSLDFPPLPASPATYRHDDRTITAFGGGADIHAWRSIWVRADYEYQLWPDLFGLPNSLTPNGVTVGAVYDFKDLHRR